MIKKIILIGATSVAMLGVPGVVHSADASAARYFSNCTKLNKVYHHGVGRRGARDHVTSGSPVTNFTRNTTVYNQNRGRDRDKDGVACEKH